MVAERRRVAVLGGNRIPFARSDGAYALASNRDMFTATLSGLVERFALQNQRLGLPVGHHITVTAEVKGEAVVRPYTPGQSPSVTAAQLQRGEPN